MNRDQTYLIDIATTCQTVIELIQGMSQSSFVADKRTHLAVLYEITVTGEIVKRLSPEFRQSHPEIQWMQIAGMRDKLVHDYNKVDLDLTWEVTQSSIPELLEFVLPFLPQEEIDHQRRRKPMAQVRIYYEPEMELLTVFWQPPRKNQIATELGDGVILIKDETTGEPIGMELLSYRPSDNRFDAVSVEMGRLAAIS
jgi:uncharacterized protein with HEPN domain